MNYNGQKRKRLKETRKRTQSLLERVNELDEYDNDREFLEEILIQRIEFIDNLLNDGGRHNEA